MAAGTPRRRVQVILGKPHGHATRNPPVRRLKVIGQAVPRARLRIAVHTKLGKPHGGAPVVQTRRVRPPMVILQAVEMRRRPRTHVIQGKPHGATVFPHRPRVELQAIARALRRQPLRTRLGRPGTGRRHVRLLMVLSQANQWRRTAQPRLRTHAVLGRPHGYVTRTPPVRKLTVLLQAIGIMNVRRHIRTETIHIVPHGGAVTPPPPTTGVSTHSWFVKAIGIKSKIIDNSQVDGDIGDTP